MRCSQRWIFELWSSRLWHRVVWHGLPNLRRNARHSVIFTYVDAILIIVKLTAIFLTYGTVGRISGCTEEGARILQSVKRFLRRGVLRVGVICEINSEEIMGKRNLMTGLRGWLGQRVRVTTCSELFPMITNKTNTTAQLGGLEDTSFIGKFHLL
jgi:hypothetical protein